MKHTALRAVRRYGDATEALETMISKMLWSSDPGTSGEGDGVVPVFMH